MSEARSPDQVSSVQAPTELRMLRMLRMLRTPLQALSTRCRPCPEPKRKAEDLTIAGFRLHQQGDPASGSDDARGGARGWSFGRRASLTSKLRSRWTSSSALRRSTGGTDSVGDPAEILGPRHGLGNRSPGRGHFPLLRFRLWAVRRLSNCRCQGLDRFRGSSLRPWQVRIIGWGFQVESSLDLQGHGV